MLDIDAMVRIRGTTEDTEYTEGIAVVSGRFEARLLLGGVEPQPGFCVIQGSGVDRCSKSWASDTPRIRQHDWDCGFSVNCPLNDCGVGR